MSIPAGTPMPAANQGTRRACVSRQVKQQRRGYAQAVLRALARSQRGRPTAQVQRVLRDSLSPLGVRLHYGISPRASQPDGPSSCPDPHYAGADKHYPGSNRPARLSDTDKVAAGPDARVVEQKGWAK